MSFDLQKYKQVKKIDLIATKKNLILFLKAYRAARTKAGITTEPLLHPAEEHSLSEHSEFKELHRLYLEGMAAIEHEKPLKTERRKTIFYLRFILGYSAESIGIKQTCGKDVITNESREAIRQFCHALGILELKNSE